MARQQVPQEHRLIERLLVGRPERNGLGQHARGFDKLTGLLINAAAALLGAGLTLPVIRVDTFYIFTDQYSLLQAILELYGAGEYLLTFIVAVFTIVFPTYKIATSFDLWYKTDVSSPLFERRQHRLELLGKWSMLDVFIVALTIFWIRLSAIADAEVHIGLYFFVASVLLSMITVHRLKSVARMAGVIG